MSKLDQAIRQSLSDEDAAFLAQFEAQNPIREAFATFGGPWGAMNVFAAILTFALFGVFVFCAWNAFNVIDLRETVIWSSGALLAAISVAMLKMYFWMEMNKNTTLREIKRLELQVARIAARDVA